MIKIFLSLIIISVSIQATIFPIFSYSEETGTMLGLFTLKEYDDNRSMQLFFITQKKGQMGLLNLKNMSILDERVNFRIYGSNTGQSYYGINNTNINKSADTLYASKLTSSLTIEKTTPLIWDILFGIEYIYYAENKGKNNGTTYFKDLNDIGLILGAEIDTRDRENNTNDGYLNRISLNIFSNQTTIENDIRYFQPTSIDSLLAYRIFLAQTISDENHIMYLQNAGSFNYLRGYKSNIFIDKFLGFAQVEWRKKITEWYIFCPFIEIGSIGSSPGNIEKDLVSYGIGSYFPFGSASLRLEMAFAESNREFYFGFNHVF